ncbi:MAG: flagellar basal-body MS-ring/collar protein FliF [Alphaproteobacteria bacterium]|nr:flagellar basal-body MS-ring/collar protein FliF [Alphaproteobacteria bacterium]
MNGFLDVIKQIGPARLGIMGGVVLALLAFFVFVSLRVSTPDYSLLYRDLSSADAGQVAAALEVAQIPYQISQDGSSVLAPEDQVGRARMLLAEQGLPNGGSMGYEIFDKQSGFGTTNFVQNVNQVRALEGELSRTIISLSPIRSARVHLVLPKRELFSRESLPASASVFLGLVSGNSLSREQVVSIQSLVASAVPQLKADDVSIVDSNGNLLARGGEDGDALLTQRGEEMRRSYERRVQNNIEELVGNVVGYNKVRANVTVDLKFDRVSTNQELYDPEGQVVRSTQTVEESDRERAPQNQGVSVENNLPGIGGDLLGMDSPTQEASRVEETTNYEISKTIRSTVSEVGEVNKLSIAVLIDGSYVMDEEGNKTYSPRTQQQLDQIYALVRSAVGFDEARGDSLEVINMQFAEVEIGDIEQTDTILGFAKDDLLETAEVLTVAVMIILVVLLVLQPMIGRLISAGAAEGEDEGSIAIENELLGSGTSQQMLASPGPTGAGGAEMPMGELDFDSTDEEEVDMISMDRIAGQVKASSVKKVEDIIDQYPNEAVTVLRGWMEQDN